MLINRWASTFPSYHCWVGLQEMKCLHQHQTPNQWEEQHFWPNHIPTQLYGNKTAGVQRNQKWYFLYWFRQVLRDTLRGYWVLASLPRTTSYLQSISEAFTLGWGKEKSAEKGTTSSTVFITVSPALNTILAQIRVHPVGTEAGSTCPKDLTVSFSSQIPIQWRHVGSLKLAVVEGKLSNATSSPPLLPQRASCQPFISPPLGSINAWCWNLWSSQCLPGVFTHAMSPDHHNLKRWK